MSTKSPGELPDVAATTNFRQLVDDALTVLTRRIWKKIPTYVSGVATTTKGPPTTGTHVLDEHWIDSLKGEFVCTVAGTPGTWLQIRPHVATSFPSGVTNNYWCVRSDLGFTSWYYNSTLTQWFQRAGPRLQWQYINTTTAADPGSGKLRFNNGTIASATAIYISETDAAGLAVGPEIGSWDDYAAPVRAILTVRNLLDPAKFAVFSLTAAITDNGTWDTLTVAHVASSASPLANLDPLTIEVTRTAPAGWALGTGLYYVGASGQWYIRVGSTYYPATGVLEDSIPSISVDETAGTASPT